MSLLYIDCFSGISGDMFIGALIHAGADPVLMEKELKKLKLEEEYQLTWKPVIKNGISGMKFDVILTDKAGQTHHHDHSHSDSDSEEAGHEHGHGHHHHHVEGYDHVDHYHGEGHDGHEHGHHQHEDENGVHDHFRHQHEEGHGEHDHGHHQHEEVHFHAHSHSHEHEHTHSHDHDHSHTHSHDHDGSHHHHHHHPGQRNYREIVQLIEAAGFNENVKKIALGMFAKIGKAEGKIHGVPLENVHFHEVGAVDSIIDIVGAAILIDQLKVTSIQASPIPVGTGNIKIDHGIYPVPAPATLEILKGIPIYGGNTRGELTTPTGAAIAAVLVDEFTSIPPMQVHSVGYGAGTKMFKEHPNVLRVLIGEA